MIHSQLFGADFVDMIETFTLDGNQTIVAGDFNSEYDDLIILCKYRYNIHNILDIVRVIFPAQSTK